MSASVDSVESSTSLTIFSYEKGGANTFLVIYIKQLSTTSNRFKKVKVNKEDTDVTKLNIPFFKDKTPQVKTYTQLNTNSADK